MEPKQAELEISEIKRVIADSRRILVDDGKGFIVWGILVAAGLILSYLSVLKVIEWNVTSIAWILLIAGGWVYTFFQVKRERKQKRVSTFAGKTAGAIWGSAGVTMTIIGFAGSYSKLVPGLAISPLMASVLGAAFFVSGVVYGDKLFRLLGAAWWAGSIIMFFWHSPHTLLMFALMMLFMQALPGIILYRKWKNELNTLHSN